MHAFNTKEEKLLGKCIIFAKTNRICCIFGKSSKLIADRLEQAGLLISTPIESKTSKLSYIAIYPTTRGREVWKHHLATPNRKPSGGKNRVLSKSVLEMTLAAMNENATVSGTARALGVSYHCVRYRLRKIS